MAPSRLAEPAPPSEGPPVTSHNDVNPTNLVWDGERLLLIDWDAAGPNDPFYDLAAVAVFLRMDDETSKALLAAHDGAMPATLPARFAYDRCWRRLRVSPTSTWRCKRARSVSPPPTAAGASASRS